MNLKNTRNVGDSLLQINFMRRACMENKQLEFDYYCKDEYHEDLGDFTSDCQIRLLPLNDAKEDTVDTWIAAPCHGDFYHKHPRHAEYPYFYLDFFAMLSEKIGIKNPIKSIDDVMLYHPDIVKSTDHLDILVIDCPPSSDQLKYVVEDWDSAVKEWKKCGRAVATVRDMGLSLLEIALLATSTSRVVAIGTGPLHAAFNTVAAQTVKRWDIFDRYHSYRYNSRVNMHSSSESLVELVKMDEDYIWSEK